MQFIAKNELKSVASGFEVSKNTMNTLNDTNKNTYQKSISQDFTVLGMTCAACAVSVESMLQSQKGVKNVQVNLMNKSVRIDYLHQEIEIADFQKTLQKIGYQLLTEEDTNTDPNNNGEQTALRDLKVRTYVALALGFLVMGFAMIWGHGWQYSNEISLLLSIPVLFWAGRGFFVKAVKQIRHQQMGMDTLVALSTSIAFALSVFNTFFPEFWARQGLTPYVYYETAVMIIAFVLLGKYLEERAKAQGNSAIRQLMDLQPKMVNVVRNGEELIISLKEVKEADRIQVRPGERIPVDGLVVQGTSHIDESTLTGEPLPVEKKRKAPVYAGTINQEGNLLILAKEIGEKTRLGQIISTVREAQGSKAPIQKKVDAIAAIFVPVVLLIALLTFCIWLLIGGSTLLNQALLATVSVLVIACPCALGLATPTALTIGIGRAAELGILIKNAEHLEKFAQSTVILLDKTGTLTEGKPTVKTILWNEKAPSSINQAILYQLEKQSEHPLAHAVCQYLKEKVMDKVALKDFKNQAGKGVEATHAQLKYKVGKADWILNEGIEIADELQQAINQLKQKAFTLVYFANQTTLLAVIGLEDSLKVDAIESIKALKKLSIKPVILSGDRHQAVAEVARILSIQDFQGDLLPSDKAIWLKKYQSAGEKVAMVGDGVNDAEALALAEVSVAMGKGTDIAMEVAGITLIHSKLSDLVVAYQLSRLTQRRIYQNLFWAFIYNLVCLPVAAGILYPFYGFLLNPMLAGAAMALSSVSVVSNSLRLKWQTLKTT